MSHAPASHNSIHHVIAGMISALRVMADRFTEKFGAPASVLKSTDLYGALRQSSLRWLNDMEACVRRLLLLRACLFPAPDISRTEPAEFQKHEPSPARIAPAWKGEGKPEEMYGLPDDSAQWRVCFALPCPRETGWAAINPYADHNPHQRSRRAGAEPSQIGYWADDPREIAMRFEALLRVIDNPEHYAQRLAARLYHWRGQNESRQALLRAMCATAQIANEAQLDDDDWRPFAEAKELCLTLKAQFSQPRLSSWRPSG